jgi:hypothetical protein
MSTDFRALCAELLAALEIQLDELRFNNRLCVRARAALAQPEPVAPTDDELMDLWLDCVNTSEAREPYAFVRAVLARWGTPANNTREENLDG